MASVLLSIVSQNGLTVQFNLNVQTGFDGAASLPPAEFTLVELPEGQQALQQLLKQIQTRSPNRLFWVLPDKPLEEIQINLIKQYDIRTIKIPKYSFDSQGQFVQQDTSGWQPSAGYLINIDNSWGVSRTIPGATLQAPFLDSPTKAQHSIVDETSSDDYWGITRYLDFSHVNINSPILTRSLISEENVLDSFISSKDVYLLANFQLTQASVVLASSVADADKHLNWHPVQYHAASLIAHEQGAFVIEFYLIAKALIGLLFASAFAVIFLVSPSRYKRLSALSTLVLLFVLLAFIAPSIGHIAPLLEMLVLSLVLWLAIEINFNQQRQQSLMYVDGNLNREIKDSAKKFQAAQEGYISDFWKDVATLIYQNLNLHRTIFFQLDKGSVHLNEISSINCQLDDIFEMRRDIRREPYVQAVLSKQAVDASRPYFKDKAADEYEILTPFFKGASVLGFWALTTKENDPEQRRQLMEQVNLLATQISVLLDLQQQNATGEQRHHLDTRRYGSYEQTQLLDISHKLNGLITESNNYKSLFSSMATPAVLFDVFGQLNMVNKALQKITSKAHIKSLDVSAFDLLTQLLPLNEDSLRNIIRQLTLEQSIQVHRFFVNLNDEEFVAVLSAVKREEENVYGQNAHLQISGLLCEFHSLKEIQNYLEIERGLYDNYLIKIKDHLSTLQMGLIQIERKAENPLLNQLSAYLNVELKKASDITRRTHYFMNKVMDRKQSNALPFTPSQTLQKCLDKVQKDSNQSQLWRGVNFNSDIPTFSALGLGSPEIFEKIINTGLRLLADDAITPKTINIMARHLEKDGEDILYFKLESEGYGLPNDQLQQMYERNLVLGENTILSELLMALQNAKDANMDCRLKSKVGKGYRLSILIEGISLHE